MTNVQRPHILRNSFLIFGIIFFLFFSYTKIYNYYSFAEEKIICYEKGTKTDDTIRIIMIGDSWAAYHHNHGYDSILSIEIEQRLTRPVSFVSSGMVGAKTKTIYELMFDSVSNCGTWKLIEQHPDYCIISAGINDAIAKMGSKNYCHHYSLILKQLITNDIRPIIIDMPDVGYKSVYRRESLTAKLRHRISSVINHADMWSFNEYRQTLKDEFNEQGLDEKIIYIPASSWNPDGCQDERNLYKDDVIHLNAQGYLLLDSCIANYIIADIFSNSYFQ